MALTRTGDVRNSRLGRKLRQPASPATCLRPAGRDARPVQHESTAALARAVFDPKPNAAGPSGYAKFLLSTGISYFDWTGTFGESKVSKKEN